MEKMTHISTYLRQRIHRRIRRPLKYLADHSRWSSRTLLCQSELTIRRTKNESYSVINPLCARFWPVSAFSCSECELKWKEPRWNGVCETMDRSQVCTSTCTLRIALTRINVICEQQRAQLRLCPRFCFDKFSSSCPLFAVPLNSTITEKVIILIR